MYNGIIVMCSNQIVNEFKHSMRTVKNVHKIKVTETDRHLLTALFQFTILNVKIALIYRW